MEFLKKRRETSQEDTRKISETVSQILLDVEKNGIEAIRRYSFKFDNWNPKSFRISAEEIAQARGKVPDHLAEHISFAQTQVRSFAELQRANLKDFEKETLPGVILGQKHIPVNAVGAYVPGGIYPLIASAIMTIVVAKAAGVKRVAACAPPERGLGRMNPIQLFTISTSGADEIFTLGGVQALCALAFGMEDVPPLLEVDTLVGAGNAYVAEAKRQLFGRVGIDLLAGPTEILVLADETAKPGTVAADLLGQAEHGPTSPAILVTDSRNLARGVIEQINILLNDWPTAAIAGKAWQDFGEVILCKDAREMAQTADSYASEHVEVQTTDPSWFLEHLTNYGSLFLGDNATVVYGDKGIGTNHVLPTGRAAKYTGGLWVGKFLKCVTWQQVTAEGNA
ncbi:MAG: histidinol dehydrogenase, partial [Verrucomicrobia bacterium]|nr:histidinol dehydrogenase [Verrucomicrobiota bacterium]